MEPYLKYVKTKKDQKAEEAKALSKLRRLNSFGSSDFKLSSSNSDAALGAARLLRKQKQKAARGGRSPLRRPLTDVERALVHESTLYEEAQSLFNIFDTNNNGWIDINAFGSLIEETMHVTGMDRQHNPREVRDIICHELFYKNESQEGGGGRGGSDSHPHQAADGRGDRSSSSSSSSSSRAAAKKVSGGVAAAIQNLAGNRPNHPVLQKQQVDMDTFFAHFKLIHRWTEWEESGSDGRRTSFRQEEARAAQREKDILSALSSIPGGHGVSEPESLRTTEHHDEDYDEYLYEGFDLDASPASDPMDQQQQQQSASSSGGSSGRADALPALSSSPTSAAARGAKSLSRSPSLAATVASFPSVGRASRRRTSGSERLRGSSSVHGVRLPKVKLGGQQSRTKNDFQRALLRTTAKMRKLKSVFGRKKRERQAARSGLVGHLAVEAIVSSLADVRKRRGARSHQRGQGSEGGGQSAADDLDDNDDDGDGGDGGSPSSVTARERKQEVVHHHNAIKVHLPAARTKSTDLVRRIKRIFGTFIYRDFHALDLSSNSLDDRIVPALLAALSKHVFEMDISRNQIGLTGCTELGKYLALPVCNLQELNLANNKINDVSVVALAQGIQLNPLLHRLDLSNNSITAKGANALAAGFEVRHARFYRSTFKNDITSRPYLELNLSWNRVGTALPRLLCLPYLESLAVASNALGRSSLRLRNSMGSPKSSDSAAGESTSMSPEASNDSGGPAAADDNGGSGANGSSDVHGGESEAAGAVNDGGREEAMKAAGRLGTFWQVSAELLSLRHLKGSPHPSADELLERVDPTVNMPSFREDALNVSAGAAAAADTPSPSSDQSPQVDVSEVRAGTVACADLVFLDLSKNGIDVDGVRYLGEQLVSNHVLLSLHIFGNADGRCWVDARGFVKIFDKKEERVSVSGIRSRRMEPPRKKKKEDLDWVSAAPVRERALTAPLPRGTICWLGQRWHEERFVCTVPPQCVQQLVFQNTGINYDRGSNGIVHGKDFHLEVFLHLECDDWGGDMMFPASKPELAEDGVVVQNNENSSNNALRFELWRMVPSNLQHFYFSLHFVEDPFSKVKMKRPSLQVVTQRHLSSRTALHALAALANATAEGEAAAAARSPSNNGSSGGGGGGGRSRITRRSSMVTGGLKLKKIARRNTMQPGIGAGKSRFPRRKSSMLSANIARQLTGGGGVVVGGGGQQTPTVVDGIDDGDNDVAAHMHRSMLTFTTSEYPTETWDEVMVFHRQDVTPPASEFIDVTVQEFNSVRVLDPHGPIRVDHAHPRTGPLQLSVRQKIHEHERPEGVKESHPLLQLQKQPVARRGAKGSRITSAKRQAIAWGLNYSVFSMRKKECDSRAFIDGPRMLEAACAADWHMMKIPYEFRQQEEHSRNLEAHLHKHFAWYCALFRQACTMFTHVPSYAEINPPESAVMLRAASLEFLDAPPPALELDGFLAFLDFAGLMDDVRLTPAVARQIFIAANVEMEAAGNLDLQLLNQMNSDLAMCRYEFLEALFRIALVKFFGTDDDDDKNERSSAADGGGDPTTAVEHLLYVR